MNVPLSKRLASETLGTGILVATVVGSGIMAERLAGGNIAVALLGNTIPTGAILVVLILIFGPLSGAHLNPVVSIVMAMRKEMPWQAMMLYALAQIIGGCLGTLLAHGMFELPLVEYGLKTRTGTGQWLAEAVATFGLILTILAVARQRAHMIPVSVGLYITAAYWFTSSTSFANPAMTIARALTRSFSGIAVSDVLPFILCQVIGAITGLLLANWLFEAERIPTISGT